MALQLKYKDEHGVVQINMSPTSDNDKKDTITDPKFDTINNRFAQYDLFGGKYDDSGGETPQSLFRSRYNSIEEELANTPYAFTTERSLRVNSANKLDITIERLNDISPSRDIEDDRFFKKSNLDDDSLFGSQIDHTPSFTVTQLIHAQDRYFDLSGRSVESDGRDVSGRTSGDSEEAFKVLGDIGSKEAIKLPVVPTKKRNKESSFAILAEVPISRPSSPRSLPVDIRRERVSPFRGRGFREETSRHNTPKTSAGNSRASSPPRRRTKSLSRIDNMATTAALPLPILSLSRPHSPRNFVKENIEEVRGLSELNREKHEAEAEQKRLEEENSLLKEMGLLDKNKSGSRSIVASTSNSRSNSPSKFKIRSRSNSPSAILHYESIPTDSKEFVNPDDGIRKPVMHRSRLRPVSKSQPQSNDGSPKHSKIPKRQNSASPPPSSARNVTTPTKPESSLSKNQKHISNSTNSIHETIKIGSQVHDKRRMSKSTQNLNISPAHIKGKPPISPGRGGPPPSNKTINSKRLSPIVGTPNKSPVEDLKPSSAKVATKPTPVPRKTVKTAGNTPVTSRLNSRQSSRPASRDPSPEKRKALPKSTNNIQTKPVARTSSTRSVQKPTVSKTEPKKPINRTNSMKSLTRTPSTKNLLEKPPLKRNNSKIDISEKALSTSKINEIGGKKNTAKDIKKLQKDKGKPDILSKVKKEQKKSIDATTEAENVIKQDNETQYDKITNEKGELVLLTKKNIMSMTTAAITSQPLQLVTTVTNQLPAALEKAREKGLFERLSSKDSLIGKDNDTSKETKEKDTTVTIEKEAPKEKETIEEKEKSKEKDIHKEIEPKITEPKETIEEKEVVDEKKPVKIKYTNFENKTLFNDDHIKLRPLQPPYNNPHVERVKQKIDDILKEPEVSTENILTASAKSREVKNTFKNIADKTKIENKEKTDVKKEINNKLSDIKDKIIKENEKITEEIRSEATKIVDSIITPVEAPKDITEKINNFTESIKNVPEKLKNLPKKIEDIKKDIEPIVMVVNEKKKDGEFPIDKVNKTVVTGGGEVEVQSSNLSTPGVEKMAVQNKMADGNVSDKSAQSNGGFPQSTSTTPKPPARARKEKDKSPSSESKLPQEPLELLEPTEYQKPPNFCQRLINKCKAKCCSCCVKEDGEKEKKEREDSRKQSEEKDNKTGKKGMMNKLNCCKKDVQEQTEQEIRDMEVATGKASIQYEDEMKRKRKLRDVFCGCCGRKRRVSDTSASIPRNVAGSMSPAPGEEGCCGRQKRSVERRDSILSDRPPTSCCNNALCRWARGMCRRGSEPSSRRTSMFSKNKSLSPTLPPEDTRKKLDTSLVEHTSVMRGAIPVLPIALAYFCMVCNILVPGLGTIFSGMFCLCFGIPRFGVHDGAKYRIGSFVINLLVGCGQLFTVLFCLVGWGWSIWWGVIMVRISRKYRKLKAEADAAEAEAPPVTSNNHTRA